MSSSRVTPPNTSSLCIPSSSRCPINDDIAADTVAAGLRKTWAGKHSTFARLAVHAADDRPGPGEIAAPGYTSLELGGSWLVVRRVEIRGVREPAVVVEAADRRGRVGTTTARLWLGRSTGIQNKQTPTGGVSTNLSATLSRPGQVNGRTTGCRSRSSRRNCTISLRILRITLPDARVLSPRVRGK